MTNSYEAKGRPLDEKPARALRAYILTHGPVAGQRRFSLSKNTLAAAAAGFPIFPSTEDQIISVLRELAAESA